MLKRRWTDFIDMFGVITYTLIIFILGLGLGLLTDLWMG